MASNNYDPLKVPQENVRLTLANQVANGATAANYTGVEPPETLVAKAIANNNQLAQAGATGINTAIQAALAEKVNVSSVGENGGVAPNDLDSPGTQAALAVGGFPHFRRTWNKLSDMLGSSPSGQLRFAAFGDSLGVENGAQKFLAPHLRTLYGFAGMITPVGFAGGSFPVSSGVTTNSGFDFTVSPFGKYVTIDSSGEWVGLYLGNGSVGYYPFAIPQNSPYAGLVVDTIKVYYTRESGAGTFKVQTTTDGSVWSDVSGLTSIDANNATTELGIATGTISSQYVKGVRAFWLSGSVKIIAAGAINSTGVGIVQIESSVGGMDIGEFAGSPLAEAWIDDLSTDFYTFSARDGATEADPSVIAANIAALQELIPDGTEAVYYGIPQASTDTDEEIIAYNEAVRAGADSVNALFLSYYDFANYAEANALGWMNGVHPTNEFASRVAQATLLSIGISIPVHGLGRLSSVLTLPRLNSVPASPDNGIRLSTDSDLGFVIQSPTGYAKIAVPSANRSFSIQNKNGAIIVADSGDSDKTTLSGPLWVSMSNSRAVLNNTGGATNEKIWDFRASGVTLAGRVVNDADSSAANWILINRVGTVVQSVAIPAPTSIGSGATQVTRIKHGTATLVAGTVTVSDTSITANSRVFVNRFTDGGTVGASYSVARSAGASFTITAKDGVGVNQTLDTSVVAYEIVEP